MAHFAKVNFDLSEAADEGQVVTVIVADQEFIDSYVDNEPGEWIQCSYNTNGGVHYDPETHEPSADQSKALRKNYPSKGDFYSAELDACYGPKPFPSWVLNSDTCYWEAPIAKPDETTFWMWDEDAYQADNTEGWYTEDGHVEVGVNPVIELPE